MSGVAVAVAGGDGTNQPIINTVFHSCYSTDYTVFSDVA